MDIARINTLHPSYWNLDPATKNTGDQNGWRWQELARKQAIAEKRGVSFNGLPLPSDPVEKGFKDLLRDFDADFLWHHLSPEDRRKVDSLASEWREQVKALIKPLYDARTSEGRNRVIGATEVNLRAQVASRKKERIVGLGM